MPIIIRYSNPSKFDKAPRGTIWKSMGDNNEHAYYIQICEDTENPRWQTLGEFFTAVFEPLLMNESFIEQCFSIQFDEQSFTLDKL